MTYGCVLINVDNGKVTQVLEKIKKIDGVIDAFECFGRFDIVVLIQTSDVSELAMITAEINSIEGVDKTETLVAS
ncbi:MAG: Lrp/AsnC ligand binding domain-containing protein [Thermoproteota archaeon]|nr:Lrp/AsnC ligand binding domain-containing protein [Candidatus Brockarchaeota archaeon]MBO3840240.1 Lrp/AsnC ligand binding domain-containing protein [Candidatus Brockarchaeota archaeon]